VEQDSVVVLVEEGDRCVMTHHYRKAVYLLRLDLCELLRRTNSCTTDCLENRSRRLGSQQVMLAVTEKIC